MCDCVIDPVTLLVFLAAKIQAHVTDNNNDEIWVGGGKMGLGWETINQVCLGHKLKT